MTQSSSTRAAPLLERSDELAALDRALASARRGVGGAVLLEGEPGIGKTALLGELRERGAPALYARGSPLEHGFAFAIVRQLFEAHLIAASDDERAALLGGPARLAATLFEPGAAAAPAATEYELLQGLHWLCANVAGDGALLLAIDDVHWADAPSLRFIHYLLGRLEELPVLVALARCTGEPAAEPELLATIAGAPITHVVRPRALSPAGVAELIVQHEDPATATVDADACHAATGGNPFLLRALLAEVVAGSCAVPIGDAGPPAVAGDQLPRLERCSPHAVALAEAVAVLDPGAQLLHAAALAGCDESSALQAAGALADHGVLCAGETWCFVHPIVRNAIYERMGTAGRAHAHARAAELLAADGAPVEQVAGHLLRTSPGGSAAVVATLRDAAGDALAGARPAAAAAYLRRALAEPAPAGRASLLFQLGRAELRLSHPAAATEHLSAALEEIGDRGLRAEVGLDLARALVMAGRCPQAVAVLEGLIAELGEAGGDAPRLKAELAAAVPVGARGGPPLAERVPPAPGPDDSSAIAATRVLLSSMAFEAATQGADARRAATFARTALDGGALLKAEGSESLHFYRAAWTLVLCDDVDEADEALRAAAADASARGSRLGAAAADCFRSAALARRGRLEEADAAAVRALRVAQDGWTVGVPLAAAFRADVLVERDELAAAEELIEEAGIAGAVPGSAGSRLVRYARGRVRIATGRLEEGLDDLLYAAPEQPHGNVRGAAVGAWHAEMVAALAGLGRMDEAEQIAREGVALTRAFGTPSAVGSALRAAGAVERGPGAPKLLRQAIAVLRRSPARLELARAFVDLGAVLRRRNRRSAARRELRAGLELAEDCGAVALARRAHAELQAAGTRPRRPLRKGVDALTASERRVAELAAQGRSNREIAQQLFVTVKTVEWHLGQTYRKLGVRSRRALPDALGLSGERIAGADPGAADAGGDARVAPDANAPERAYGA